MGRTAHALILAAGVGARLLPQTALVPKPLVPVQGHAILDRALDALVEKGVQHVSIVAGHLESVLRDHVARRTGAPEIEIVINPRFASTNSMFSLLLGLAALEDSTWVIEGDVVFDAALLDRPLPYPITWLVDRSSPLTGSFVTADAGGRARGVDIVRERASVVEGAGKSIGILHIDRKALGTVRRWLALDVVDRYETDYYDLTLGRRMPAPEIGVVDVSGYRWYEIDTLDDLERAEELFR